MSIDTVREAIDEIQKIKWLIDEGPAHTKLTEAQIRLTGLKAALSTIDPEAIPLIHGRAELDAHDEAIRREALLDAKAAIELDKSTFAGVGRDTKGHARSLMLIDEILGAERDDGFEFVIHGINQESNHYALHPNAILERLDEPAKDDWKPEVGDYCFFWGNGDYVVDRFLKVSGTGDYVSEGRVSWKNCHVLMRAAEVKHRIEDNIP